MNNSVAVSHENSEADQTVKEPQCGGVLMNNCKKEFRPCYETHLSAGSEIGGRRFP